MIQPRRLPVACARAFLVLALGSGALAAGESAPAAASGQAPAAAPAPAGSAEQQMQQAASAGKYALLCLWQGGTVETQAFRKAFAEAAAKESHRAVAIEVQADAAANAALVVRLQLDRAPRPLALAFAPNGAVTRGWQELPAEGFGSAFVGPGLASCLKVTQEGKMAVIGFANARTRDGEATLATARAFLADDAVKAIASLVTIDPAAAADRDLCTALKIASDTTVSQVALLVPPGRLAGLFQAPVTKEQLLAALAQARAGCGPGHACGPGGCP